MTHILPSRGRPEPAHTAGNCKDTQAREGGPSRTYRALGLLGVSE